MNKTNKTQFPNQNKIGITITDPVDIEMIIKEPSEQLYAQGYDKLN